MNQIENKNLYSDGDVDEDAAISTDWVLVEDYKVFSATIFAESEGTINGLLYLDVSNDAETVANFASKLVDTGDEFASVSSIAYGYSRADLGFRWARLRFLPDEGGSSAATFSGRYQLKK